MLGHVDRLIVDGMQASQRRFQIRGLDVNAGTIFAGEPFQATVKVNNPGAKALGEVSLAIGNNTESRKVLLKAGETAEVAFADISVEKEGPQRAQAGSYMKDFTVTPNRSGIL